MWQKKSVYLMVAWKHREREEEVVSKFPSMACLQ
jgi:hypothetical protein